MTRPAPHLWIATLKLTLALTLFSPLAHANSLHILADSWPYAAMGALGGLTFLLYGLNKMTSAFKALAGERLRLTLSTLTRNRFSSLFTGMVVTAIVQSSAATTVMVVGFIAARLMSLPQSLGVILGADIGTTLTVQLIAFRLNQYALIAIAFGFAIKHLIKGEVAWQIGRVVMAVGTVFFGIFMISESMDILHKEPEVATFISHITSPVLAVCTGMLLTALMQSSAATMAIFIALASQHILPLDSAIMMMLGANIGTCFTAVVASLGKRTEAKRAAAAHAFFKISGALLLVPFIPWFVDLVSMISNEAVGQMATPRQIANSHTLFNIMLALLFLPLIDVIARVLTKLIPSTPTKTRVEAEFLDPYLMSTPSLALNAARSESARMATYVAKMMDAVPHHVLESSEAQLRNLRVMEKDVDALYRQIMAYLGEISRHELSEKSSRELIWLMAQVNHLERIANLMGDDMYAVGIKRIKRQVNVSSATKKLLLALHDNGKRAVNHSIQSFTTLDKEAAKKVIPLKEDIRADAEKATAHQAKRLIANEENRVNTYALEMDIVDKLQRIYYHTRKMAEESLEFLTDEPVEK